MTIDSVGIAPQVVAKVPEKIFLDFFAESPSEGLSRMESSDSGGFDRIGSAARFASDSVRVVDGNA